MRTKDRVNVLLDNMMGYLLINSSKNQLVPIMKIFLGYVLSYEYYNRDSKYYKSRGLLTKSWDSLVDGLDDWKRVVSEKPNHTHDVSSWIIYNYLTKIPEIHEDQKELLNEYLVSTCNDAISRTSRASLFLDVPNHAILRVILCEYAYALTKNPKYRKKGSRMLGYVLDKFTEGIAPEFSLNYSSFITLLLSQLYEQTQDTRLLRYIKETSTAIPVFLYGKDGDAICVDNREVLKTLTLSPFSSLFSSMIMAANVLGDGKYLSVAEKALSYLERHTVDGRCVSFPKWKPDYEVTDTTGIFKSLGSDDAITVTTSFFLSLANDYIPRNIEPKKFLSINNIQTSKLFIIKKNFGDCEAVVSNVYPSPVAYMTPGTSIAGWVPSKELYRKTGNLSTNYNVIEKNFVTIFCAGTKSHSTSFFYNKDVIWVHTLERNSFPDLRWTGFLYTNDSKKILVKSDGKIIEIDLAGHLFPLKWILFPINGEKYLGVAELGNSKLGINKEIQVVFKEDGEPEYDTFSVLLIKMWNGNPREWDKWLALWSVKWNNKLYEIKTPDKKEFIINHRNTHLPKRVFSKVSNMSRKFYIFYL